MVLSRPSISLTGSTVWRGEENQGPGLMVFFFHINDIETTMATTICCYLYNSKRRGNKWPVCQFIRRSSDAQMPAQHCWHSFNKILAGKSSGSIFHPIEDMFLFVISRSLCPPTLGRNAWRRRIYDFHRFLHGRRDFETFWKTGRLVNVRIAHLRIAHQGRLALLGG